VLQLLFLLLGAVKPPATLSHELSSHDRVNDAFLVTMALPGTVQEPEATT
jgi:hypothetical protein